MRKYGFREEENSSDWGGVSWFMYVKVFVIKFRGL